MEEDLPDRDPRLTCLDALTSLESISPDGARGLAMLRQASVLASGVDGLLDDPLSNSGNLIGFCIREALDSIFPRIQETQIRAAASHVINKWQRFQSQPGDEGITALRDTLEALDQTLSSANQGFVPRVSKLLGGLYPNISSDISLPAMRQFQQFRDDANRAVHGSMDVAEAISLLDNFVNRLIEVAGPLTTTAVEYQSLVDAGNFSELARRLSLNSDPRVRLFLFDSVRDARLAESVELSELLPSEGLWLSFGYVRYLANSELETFAKIVDRAKVSNLLTSGVAGQLLICACLAGPEAAVQVDRLARIAGTVGPPDHVVRWLRSTIGKSDEIAWWSTLAYAIRRTGKAASQIQYYNLPDVIKFAIESFDDADALRQSMVTEAAFLALADLDHERPYTVQFFFDNQPRDLHTSSDVLIDACVRLLSYRLARGEGIAEDLSRGLSAESMAVVERAAVAQAIAAAGPGVVCGLSERALSDLIGRIVGGEWPGAFEDLHIEELANALGSDVCAARLAEALGDAPDTQQVSADLAKISESRADWFRQASWAGYLPGSLTPDSWSIALEVSAEAGITFGPLPPQPSLFATPTTPESVFTGVDLGSLDVSGFVSLINAELSTREPADMHLAVSIQDPLVAHVAGHRSQWKNNITAILNLQEPWIQKAVIAAMNNGEEAMPLSWEELQELWTATVNRTATTTEGHEVEMTIAEKQAFGSLVRELLHQLCERATTRSRTNVDVCWWIYNALPDTLTLLRLIGSSEPETGFSVLFSVRGQLVRLLIEMSSPLLTNTEHSEALDTALNELVNAALPDQQMAACLGNWASWLIRRSPQWWAQNVDSLVGPAASPDTRRAILDANFRSGDFAPALLSLDIRFLNFFASSTDRDAAHPVLWAVLYEIVRIDQINDTTWSAMFRDNLATDTCLRYLFPTDVLEGDPAAARRLQMLAKVCENSTRAAATWRALGTLAGSPDVSDDDLFDFAAGLAATNRGVPMSSQHLIERITRTLPAERTVKVLESMCSGNLGPNRPMAQYDLESINVWFLQNRGSVPTEQRTRITNALFEIGLTTLN